MSHTFDGCFFRVSDFFFLAMILARANSFRNERSNHEKNVFPCDHTLTRTHTYTIPAHHSFQNDADDFRYHRFGHSIVFLYTCQWHVTLYAVCYIFQLMIDLRPIFYSLLMIARMI